MGESDGSGRQQQQPSVGGPVTSGVPNKQDVGNDSKEPPQPPLPECQGASLMGREQQPGDPAVLSLIPSSSMPSAMEEVRLAAERVAVGASIEPSLTLDGIWQRDLDRVDLPEYVQAHSTTISFPEKVSVPTATVVWLHVKPPFKQQYRTNHCTGTNS